MKPSVLIVLTGSLGDVVRGLALPGLLRRAGVAGRVGWVVERRWRELVEAHPAVDRVLAFDRTRPLSRASYRALRSEPWHVCLDLQRLFKSGLLARLSGAPRRIGVPRSLSRESNWLFQTEHVEEPSAPAKMDLYLSFARHLGAPIALPLDFGLERLAAAGAGVQASTGSGPILTLVLGSSRPPKDWPVARAAELIDRLVAESRVRVVLVGAACRRDEAAALVARAPTRVTDLVGRTTLAELAFVLRRSLAAVGPDSGPGHLAAALGRPYVGLFGPTDPRRVAPWGCEDLVVASPVPCGSCSKRRCRRGTASCMAAIDGEAVWQKLAPLLAADASARG